MLEFFAPAARGFALGLGLIVAIGAQNAFVLERGLQREHVLVVCLVCAVSDAFLIAAGVGGLGTWIAARPMLITVVTIAGAAFLGAYALKALRRALQPSSMDVGRGRRMSLGSALVAALGLTFLNPHVYLDTVMLLGSLSAGYATQFYRIAYAGGAAAASFLWFFALGYGARLIAPLFRRPGAWRVLDGVIFAVMATLALGLVASLL